MAEALENAGKRYEMVVYPQKTHGLSGGSQKHFLEETLDFFERTLK